MNRLHLCILALTFYGCQSTEENKDLSLNTNNESVEKHNIDDQIEYSVREQHDVLDEFYSIDFETNSNSDTSYDLILKINLKNGGHFVSPNATGNFSGKFTMQVTDTDAFDLVGNHIEIPLSVEEIDPHPFVNGPINWVRQNTTYKQRIKINTQEDFLVFGHIQFTIEPSCTLEKIPFIIKYQSGKVVFELDNC